MRISVGNLLTIRGHDFRSKAKRNTVIFRAGNGRSAFAKPRRASSTKLVVRVPAAVARLLTVKNSKQRPTRLKLRVLAGKFSAYTSPALAGRDRRRRRRRRRQRGQGLQGRLRSRQRPAVRTPRAADRHRPCLADTDDDHMSDGWEYYVGQGSQRQGGAVPRQAAVPERARPLGRRRGQASPYDFDGDGLTTREEYRAWRRHGQLVPRLRRSAARTSSLRSATATAPSSAGPTRRPGVPNWQSASTASRTR